MLKKNHYHLIQDLDFTACSSGTYGQDCAETCGNCDGGAPCDAVDGSCATGCAPGWTGGTCSNCEYRFYF